MSTVIDVRIVNESSTSDLLAILALVVSGATFLWTLWARRDDQARLKISQYIGMPVGIPGTLDQYIGVDATNVGRAGETVVKSIHLSAGRRGGKLWSMPNALIPEAELPATLRPGESVTRLIDPRGVALVCAQNHIDIDNLLVVVETGHGPVRARLRTSCKQLVRYVGDLLP